MFNLLTEVIVQVMIIMFLLCFLLEASAQNM